MKKAIIAFCFFMTTVLSNYGQWYERQYNVTDINRLTKAQLELSIAMAKSNILTASLVGAVGGISWALLKIAHEAIITSYVCAGVFAGGAIVSLANMQRIAKIKSIIKRNYPSPPGSVSISPALIKNNYNRTYTTGFTLTLAF